MEYLELVKTRQSCRDYDKTKKVGDELVLQMIECARNSPSACNSQPTKFVVVSDENLVKSFRPMIQSEKIKINLFADDVNSFIIVCETKAKLISRIENSQKYAQMDIGMATINLCNMATTLGVGTCIIGMFDEDKIKELLEIPGDIKIRLVIAVGYAKTPNIREKSRKSIEDICSFNKF